MEENKIVENLISELVEHKVAITGKGHSFTTAGAMKELLVDHPDYLITTKYPKLEPKRSTRENIDNFFFKQ